MNVVGFIMECIGSVELFVTVFSFLFIIFFVIFYYLFKKYPDDIKSMFPQYKKEGVGEQK